MDRPFNVLFLCTGNSARSILAESLIDHWGGGRLKGHSAGSFPKGEVNPLALRLLRETGMRTSDLRSKSWDEFAAPGAPVMDFVFTVCDQAAADGSDAERMLAFRAAFRRLETRIKLFVALPIASLNKLAIARKAEEIGRVGMAGIEGKAS